jgi:hypothetical protein
MPTDIRKVSLAIAVAEQSWAQGLARDARPDDPEGMLYAPVY